MATLQEALRQKLNDSNIEIQYCEGGSKNNMSNIVIKAYSRKPKRNTPEWFEFHIRAIDHRVARLATLGLAPHPNLLENRQKLQSELEKLRKQPPA